MFFSFRVLVRHLGQSVPKSGLIVLKPAESGLPLRLEFVGVCATFTTEEVEVRTNVRAFCQLEERMGEAISGVEELQTIDEELRSALCGNKALLTKHNALQGLLVGIMPIGTLRLPVYRCNSQKRSTE